MKTMMLIAILLFQCAQSDEDTTWYPIRVDHTVIDGKNIYFYLFGTNSQSYIACETDTGKHILTEINENDYGITQTISAEMRKEASCDNSIFHIGVNEESDFSIYILESPTHTQLASYDITPNINKDPVWLQANQPVALQCKNGKIFHYQFYSSYIDSMMKFQGDSSAYVKTWYDGDRPDEHYYESISELFLDQNRLYLYMDIKCNKNSNNVSIGVYQGKQSLDELSPIPTSNEKSEFRYYLLKVKYPAKSVIAQLVNMEWDTPSQLRLSYGSDFDSLDFSKRNINGNNFVVQKYYDGFTEDYLLEIYDNKTMEQIYYMTSPSVIKELNYENYTEGPFQLEGNEQIQFYTNLDNADYKLQFYPTNYQSQEIKITFFNNDLIEAIQVGPLFSQNIFVTPTLVRISSQQIQQNCKVVELCKMLIQITNINQGQSDSKIIMHKDQDTTILTESNQFKDILLKGEESKFQINFGQQIKLIVSSQYYSIFVQGYRDNLNSIPEFSQSVYSSETFIIDGITDNLRTVYTLKVMCENPQCEYTMQYENTYPNNNDSSSDEFTIWWVIVVVMIIAVITVWTIGNQYFKKKQAKIASLEYLNMEQHIDARL